MDPACLVDRAWTATDGTVSVGDARVEDLQLDVGTNLVGAGTLRRSVEADVLVPRPDGRRAVVDIGHDPKPTPRELA